MSQNQCPTICKSISCNLNLSSSDPASQYHRLKIIQNTVRVPASLYMSDLGALNVYQRPSPGLYNVNWNQMSDRAIRHCQPNITNHGSSTRGTMTRNRPGAGNPGGCGVDIKHNSYYRYMARLKGKGPVRRGVIPPTFGDPIPFNQAFPIYGGKTMKTSISNKKSESLIYIALVNPLLFNLFNSKYIFNVGNYVYAINKNKNKNTNNNVYEKAIITEINGEIYTIKFDDGTIINTHYNDLQYIVIMTFRII